MKELAVVYVTAAALWAMTAIVARVKRGRFFGIFAAIVGAFPAMAVAGLWPRAHAAHGVLAWLLAYGQVACSAQLLSLVHNPAPKRAVIRWLVSIPGLAFAAASFLALPWSIASLVGTPLPLSYAPFGLAFLGVTESLWARRETVEINLQTAPLTRLARAPGSKRRFGIASAAKDHVFRIAQISDTHLGPFMSVERLAAVCQRAVDAKPDFIALTGDMMTLESHRAEVVTQGLAPLSAYAGRVVACLGNHDLEALPQLRQAYKKLGIILLEDESIELAGRAGTLQVIGAKFMWRNRAEHMQSLCARHPRLEGALRIFLVHDPGAFRCLPEGEADLVLSGHTHGGQVGLVSLGLNWTVLRLLAPGLPDHGLWGLGKNRLYVHRCTGHYGFPLRLGVPAEESVLHIRRAG